MFFFFDYGTTEVLPLGIFSLYGTWCDFYVQYLHCRKLFKREFLQNAWNFSGMLENIFKASLLINGTSVYRDCLTRIKVGIAMFIN